MSVTHSNDFSDGSELLGTLDLPDSVPTTIVQVPPFKRKCYDCRYRFRWVPSKGASLVLVWTLLISISFGSMDNLFTGFLQVFNRHETTISYVAFLPYIPWFVFAFSSGWIADRRFGNHTMVRVGVLLSFLASILALVLQLAAGKHIDQQHKGIYILSTLFHCLGFAGRAMVLVTSVQLGLDQMPEASSSNVTSFIAWFVACLYAGNWINSLLKRGLIDCWALKHNSNQIFSFVTVVPLAVLLCSDYLLTRSWFNKDVKCPQSSKIIFQVLKFAKQHKVPINRSALTYWEEDIPPRIDLGKSKYGGPFSTEEVENVKTFFRMVTLSLSFGFIFTSFYLFQQFVYVRDYDSTILANSNCSQVMTRSFTYETSLWVVGGIVIYEFAIYPFAVPIIPSIIKRIGATSFLTIVVNGLSLLLTVIDFARKSEITDPTDTDWFWILQSLISAPLKVILLTSAIEFVCAQSPYNMKGLMIGYMWSEYYMSNIIANILAGVLHTLCHYTDGQCSVIYSSAATLLSIVGFVLFCVLARWYKRRVRDDTPTPYQWAEEVYDRYLEQAKNSY